MAATGKRNEDERIMENVTSLISELQGLAPDEQDVSLATAMTATLFHYAKPENHPGKEFLTVYGAELAGQYRFGDRKENVLNIILGKALRTPEQTIMPVSISEGNISAGVRGLFSKDMEFMLIDLSTLLPDYVAEAIRMASQAALAGHIVLLVSDRGADLDDAMTIKARHLNSLGS